MGTMIQRHKLGEADFRGERFARPRARPQGQQRPPGRSRGPTSSRGIHDAYLDAGADIIETNTFTATSIAQADYGLEAIVYELNVAAARLARAAADAWTARTPERPRFVAGAIGPTNRTLSISPDVNDPSFRAVTFDQVRGGLRRAGARPPRRRRRPAAGRDHLRHAQRARRALVAIEEVFEETGRAAAGHDLGDHHRQQRPHALGSDGRGVLRRRSRTRGRSRSASTARSAPREMRPYLAELAAHPPTLRQLLPERRAAERVRRATTRRPRRRRRCCASSPTPGCVNIVGGCCGTTPEHIRGDRATPSRGVPPRARRPRPTRLRAASAGSRR